MMLIDDYIFLKKVQEKESEFDDPFWDYLREVHKSLGVAVDNAADQARYFLAGLCLGEDVKDKILPEDSDTDIIIAYELGVAGKEFFIDNIGPESRAAAKIIVQALIKVGVAAIIAAI